MTNTSDSVRQRLLSALKGEKVQHPVFLVYDYFVMHHDIDWPFLFNKGLGRLNHASIVDIKTPHLEVIRQESVVDSKKKCEVIWKTDAGELREWYLDGWRQEYLIKTAQDYKIMACALSDIEVNPKDDVFEASEKALGQNGFTIATLGEYGEQTFLRTPFQVIQIDYVGLEKFSMDIAYESPELLELIELMNANFLNAFESVASTKPEYLKLWENLSIETMGPKLYKKHLVPVYEKLLQILHRSEKKLVVHYDGKLNVIADDIARLGFDGYDSITPPPEGDLTIKQVRELCPEKFLWIHPTLSWYDLPVDQLTRHVSDLAEQAGHYRYCFQISEDVPDNWRQTMPAILDSLNFRSV